MPVVRFSVNAWSVKSVGNFEFVGPAEKVAMATISAEDALGSRGGGGGMR